LADCFPGTTISDLHNKYLMNSALAHTRGRRRFFLKKRQRAKTEIRKKATTAKTAKKSGKTAKFVRYFVSIGEKFVFFLFR
jgi:hypothetical protein